jgi:anti-sigma factor RsiW
MTLQPPQPSAQSGIAGCAHLTGEQFGELLARSANSPQPSDLLAETHLRTCEQCSAELASLRESLALFREASTAYADRELRLLPPWRIPVRHHVAQPAYFAAAAILLISLIPMQMAHHRSHPPNPAAAVGSVVVAAGDQAAESDDALLEDVSSEASASVPTPMQALDNPGVATESSAESTDTSDQRKD